MAAPTPAPEPLRLDAAALARWAPDPEHAYTSIRNAATSGVAFDAVLNEHLHVLTTAKQMILLSDIIVMIEMAFAEQSSDDPPSYSVFNLDVQIANFVMLVERLRPDEAGMDFIGIVLISVFLHRSHATWLHVDVDEIHADFDQQFATFIAQRIIHPLLHLPPAHGLTFTRLIGLARTWAARGSAVATVNVTGFERLTLDAFNDWMAARTDAGDALVARAWDASIREARARMRDEAFAVQNELRREPRIAPDAIGTVAQFLAPPGTTQATLQRQRQIYAASIGVARLQAQADAPGLSANLARDLQDQANLARGRLHGYRDMPMALVRAGCDGSRLLYPMPMLTPPPDGWPAFGNAQEIQDDDDDDDQPYTGPEEGEEEEKERDEEEDEQTGGGGGGPSLSPFGGAAYASPTSMDEDSGDEEEEAEGEAHGSRAKKQRTSGRPVRPW